MTYVYCCLETVLTREALFETLAFLYQPRNVEELDHLFGFATATCDSWGNVDGDATCWLWLASRFEWRPKRKHLSIQDLNLIGNTIETNIDDLAPTYSLGRSLGGRISPDGKTLLVNCCTDFSLTREALLTTLSFLFQPQGRTERRQVSNFAEAVCRIWTALDGSEKCWQIYTHWLGTQVQLGRRLTCADLGSLAEKMDEHLTAFQFLKGPNPTGTV